MSTQSVSKPVPTEAEVTSALRQAFLRLAQSAIRLNAIAENFKAEQRREK